MGQMGKKRRKGFKIGKFIKKRNGGITVRYYFIGALAMMALAFIVYPFLSVIAIEDRGYNAIGGEGCVFAIAFIISLAIIQTGIDRRKKAERDDEK